jgi:hypothetical protein
MIGKETAGRHKTAAESDSISGPTEMILSDCDGRVHENPLRNESPAFRAVSRVDVGDDLLAGRTLEYDFLAGKALQLFPVGHGGNRARGLHALRLPSG